MKDLIITLTLLLWAVLVFILVNLLTANYKYRRREKEYNQLIRKSLDNLTNRKPGE